MIGRRQRPEYEFRPRLARFEFLRNLAFLAASVLVLLGAVAILPAVVSGGDDDDVEAGAELTTPTEPEEDEGGEQTEGSGRFQPTGLSSEHRWIGSREESTTTVVLHDVEHRVVLGTRGTTGALDPAVVIDVSAVGSPPPIEFDPGQVPYDVVPVDDVAYLFSAAEGLDVQHVLVRLEDGRELWVSARGVDRDRLVQLLSSVSVVDPNVEVVEEGATTTVAPTTTAAPTTTVAQPISVVVSRAGGLDVLLDTEVVEGEEQVVIDNFAVPGRAERALAVHHVTGATDFDPVAEAALSPTARLVQVRGRTGVYDGDLRWRESEDLVLELAGQGYSQLELVSLADGLVELTLDQLNRRRPPVEEIDVVAPSEAPAASFDLASLGREAALVDEVDSDPPFVAGQVVGPIVAVGRVAGSQIDLYTWQRGDGEYRECVGAVGPGVDQVRCLAEDDVVEGPTPLGAIQITDGLFAGGRLHVYRVPGATAAVSTTVGGEPVFQRPREAVVAFVVPDQSGIAVRAFGTGGEELSAGT